MGGQRVGLHVALRGFKTENPFTVDESVHAVTWILRRFYFYDDLISMVRQWTAYNVPCLVNINRTIFRNINGAIIDLAEV